jgi:acetyltransferase-like isoleucine patch superfamily enzyme
MMTALLNGEEAAYWATRSDVALPANVRLGPGSRIVADEVTRRGVFARFRSQRAPAIVVGDRSIADGAMFNLGQNAVLTIGSGCRLVDCFLIADDSIRIGDDVVVGWRATIVDSDFHPIAPPERQQDVLALSPLAAKGAERKPGTSKPVVIGDRVWIGPLAVILKGVRIGAGARIEPGAVVTRDVPAGAIMLGNPAKPVEGKA